MDKESAIFATPEVRQLTLSLFVVTCKDSRLRIDPSIHPPIRGGRWHQEKTRKENEISE
jgi:hypothetical protein